jgi:hypothetical protein
MRFSSVVILLLTCLAACDTTVRNDTSVEGEWTGRTSGTRITNSDTLNESVTLQITYQEAKDGELTGTGLFNVSAPNREDETIELEATGLRSNNTVESAFVSEVDTAVYNGSIEEKGGQIEGQLDWNRHEGTARVVLDRQ